jgi:CDGSH-type Zn-finger protein
MAEDNPKIAQKSPYVIEVEPGKYAWCACGESSKQPYCDGSHKGTGFTPIVQEVKEAGTVAWCGCKQSGNTPFCDGSHSQI